MRPVPPPPKTSDPDRFLKCQEAMADSVSEVALAAIKAGWRPEEVAAHGEEDATIPAMASKMAAAQLTSAGFGVELDVEAGTGHTISSAGAQKALSFLKKSLLLPQPG